MQDIRETLQINYEVDLARYRRIWFEDMRANLPNMLAFWGTGVFLCSVLAVLFSDTPFFIWFALMVAAIPCLMVLSGYKNYMTHIERMFSILSEEEKTVSMKFQTGENWFEIFSGKNYSRFAWESVKGVVEKNTYFIFTLGASPYPIPKDAFRSESDIQLLRMIVASHVKNDNVKLLK
jgi:hypothetical protein